MVKQGVETETETLRICIDSKDLNQALKKEHYQLPTIEEITAQMPGYVIFQTWVIGRHTSTRKAPNSLPSTGPLDVSDLPACLL